MAVRRGKSFFALLAVVAVGCAKPAQAPAPAAVTATAAASAEPAPASPEPEPAASVPPAASSSPATVGPSVGIPACDEYLALYEKCEPKLQSSIAAGERRSARAERAWIEYMKTSSEAPALPESCASLLRELEPACR